jgi:hypothetical protein
MQEEGHGSGGTGKVDAHESGTDAPLVCSVLVTPWKETNHPVLEGEEPDGSIFGKKKEPKASFRKGHDRLCLL